MDETCTKSRFHVERKASAILFPLTVCMSFYVPCIALFPFTFVSKLYL